MKEVRPTLQYAGKSCLGQLGILILKEKNK